VVRVSRAVDNVLYFARPVLSRIPKYSIVRRDSNLRIGGGDEVTIEFWRVGQIDLAGSVQRQVIVRIDMGSVATLER
jgi:hypothetical protein